MTASPEIWPVVIVGTGFAGLAMAIQLQQAGLGPFVLLERAQTIGGTWRDNHYPGCACDVPAPLYSFSFAPNPDWTRLYAHHDEIQGYLQGVVHRYALRRHIHFGQRVLTLHYDDAAHLWTVTTAAGRTYRARVVVSGMGALSTPSEPAIPDLRSFVGPGFHSAQWDHDVDLQGKRVGIVGTGASAIQFVPHVARVARHVTLFQRTPPWIVPRHDRATSPRERALYRRVPLAQKALRGWIYVANEVRALAFTGSPLLMKLAARTATKHLRAQVADPQLRATLTPNYTIGCKRILLSNDYYPALCRDNVQVVTAPVQRAVADGLRTTDGIHRPLDVLVYGTGFRVQQPFAPGMVIGRHGTDLTDAWRERMVAYKGTCVAGFPNLFFMAGPNTGLGHSSMVYMIESQARYIRGAMQAMRAGGWDSVEVDAGAQAHFNARLDARQRRTVWATGCRSWYLDDRGHNTTLWPGFTFEFRRQTAAFDAENFVVTRRRPAES